MLNIDHGTYPFVMPSNATAGGACTGTGVGLARADRVVGIARAHVTCVGEGPFPTELLDEAGERLRCNGSEFGTTTGRPRHCGWLDVPVTRHVTRVNGLTDLVLTKLDVLGGFAETPVCVACEIDGVCVDEVPVTQVEFARAGPAYELFPGWDEDVSSCRGSRDLPVEAQDYASALEGLPGCPILSIGVGPGRDRMIVRRSLVAQRGILESFKGLVGRAVVKEAVATKRASA